MPQVYWQQFTWEAFATLTTGILAVAAAYRVGRKQADIQLRQAKIQESALRSDLFERRYKVFEKAEQFIREIIQHADDPTAQTQQEFLVAMGEARFLFSPKVRGELEEIWKRWAGFHALKVTMNHLHRTEGHYGDGNPERERIELDWFVQRSSALPNVFDELQLGGVLIQD